MRELTGEWFVETSCEEIQAEKRHFFDEVVYLGNARDLETGDFAEEANLVSQFDRYNFD